MSSRGTIANAMATERCSRRGSAALGCDEEFAVAVAARNGRGDHSGDHTPAGRDKGRDVVADCGMNARITHDAALHTVSAGFELWLDQRDEGRRCLHQSERSRQHELEGDEAHINDDKVGPFREARRIEAANVGRLHAYDLRSRAQAWVPLAR